MRIQSLLLKALALAEFLPCYFDKLALQQLASVAIIIPGLLVRLSSLLFLFGLKMGLRVSVDFEIRRRSLKLPLMLRNMALLREFLAQDVRQFCVLAQIEAYSFRGIAGALTPAMAAGPSQDFALRRSLLHSACRERCRQAVERLELEARPLLDSVEGGVPGVLLGLMLHFDDVRLTFLLFLVLQIRFVLAVSLPHSLTNLAFWF